LVETRDLELIKINWTWPGLWCISI